MTVEATAAPLEAPQPREHLYDGECVYDFTRFQADTPQRFIIADGHQGTGFVQMLDWVTSQTGMRAPDDPTTETVIMRANANGVELLHRPSRQSPVKLYRFTGAMGQYKLENVSTLTVSDPLSTEAGDVLYLGLINHRAGGMFGPDQSDSSHPDYDLFQRLRTLIDGAQKKHTSGLLARLLGRH